MSVTPKSKESSLRLFAGFLVLFALFLLLMSRFVDLSDFTKKLTDAVGRPVADLMDVSKLSTGSLAESSGGGAKSNVARTAGTLAVAVEPGNGWYEIIDFADDKPVGSKTGLGTILLPMGEYKIHFREISGFQPPPDQRILLTSDSPESKVSGLYIQTDATPIEMGRLMVTPDPNNDPLTNGANTLLAFSLKAENADVNVSQLDFGVSADISPRNYKLYNVIDGFKKEIPFVQDSAGKPSFRLIQPEVISAGQLTPFLLEAGILFQGVIKPGTKATTRLALGGIESDAFSVLGLPLEQTIVKP
jgi:hypothetical protein